MSAAAELCEQPGPTDVDQHPTQKTDSPEKIKAGDSLVTEVSKKVSWILRHGMHTLVDVVVDLDEYIKVDAMWKTPGLQHLDFDTLLSQIHISNEQKKRYDLKEIDGQTWIRATKEKPKKEPKEKREPRDGGYHQAHRERDDITRRAEDDRPPKGRGKQTHRAPPERSSWGQKPKDTSQIGKQWVVANNIGEVIVREGISTESPQKFMIEPGQLVTQVGTDEELPSGVPGTGIVRMEISFQLGEESCSGWVTKTAEAVNGPRYFYPPRQDRPPREMTISSISSIGNGKDQGNGKWERAEEREVNNPSTSFQPNAGSSNPPVAAPFASKPFNQNAVPFRPRTDPVSPVWTQQSNNYTTAPEWTQQPPLYPMTPFVGLPPPYSLPSPQGGVGKEMADKPSKGKGKDGAELFKGGGKGHKGPQQIR
eukprot:GEMP01014260.1.p1 GENE.GEMP01014260.1~~GEMP01014260.1.p1  ORF type:complete len:423 (+),score=77.39 GEMP01014260.1:108-1376(+)